MCAFGAHIAHRAGRRGNGSAPDGRRPWRPSDMLGTAHVTAGRRWSAAGRDMRGRLGVLRRSTVVALVVGVLFLNLAMVSLWAWRTFASSQGFADTTTDMLKEPAVQEVLADQIVNFFESTEATSRATITARPAIEAAVAQLVATPAFRGVFHAGVRELHSGLVEGSRSSLLVDVDDTAVLVRQTPGARQPVDRRCHPRPRARRGGGDLAEHARRHRHPRRLAGRMAGGAVRARRRRLPGVGRPPRPRQATGARDHRADDGRRRRRALRPAGRRPAPRRPTSATPTASGPRCGPCTGASATSSTCRPRC